MVICGKHTQSVENLWFPVRKLIYKCWVKTKQPLPPEARPPPPGHRRMPIVRIGRGSAQLNNWDNYLGVYIYNIIYIYIYIYIYIIFYMIYYILYIIYYILYIIYYILYILYIIYYILYIIYYILYICVYMIYDIRKSLYNHIYVFIIYLGKF